MEHTIEVSPSSRASCRSCGQKIGKGELRFGEAVASQFNSSGYTHEWHHLACAADKKPAQLRPTLVAFTGEVPDREALERAMDDAAKPGGHGVPGALPTADLAPTGRAKCIACEEPIAAKSVRIAVEREINTGRFVSKGAGYLHPDCAEGWCSEERLDFDSLVAQVKANTELTELPPPFA